MSRQERHMTTLLAIMLAWLGLGQILAPRDDPPRPGSGFVIDLAPAAATGDRLALPDITPARGDNPPLVVIDPGPARRA
jgi:N-acetylmuramoyl-L-alanine amidase